MWVSSVASLVTAFVLVIVAKPPLETFLSNQLGFDMTFAYDYTFWVCLGGYVNFQNAAVPLLLVVGGF